MTHRLICLTTVCWLWAAGVFAATNIYVGDLDIGPEGVLIGDTNDLFRVGGSFNNRSTNTAYNILTATVEFTGTGAHNLEQASMDRGPCANAISNNWAFGTLVTAGSVTVVDNYANSAGDDAIYVQQILGSGTLNIGSGMKVYFGSTNGWTGTANVTGTGVFRPYLDPNLDTDGDGMLNWMECRCGTEPTNSASVLRITRIAREGNDIRVTWTTVGGHCYILQTNAPPANGSFTNNFADCSPPIIVTGTGESATNYLHIGGATAPKSLFYRVRLADP